ncbi:hypothetical protein OROGR_026499 [Orobanche gracilis]
MQVGGGVMGFLIIFSLLVLSPPSIFLVTAASAAAAGSHPPTSPNAKQAYIVYMSDQSVPKGQKREDYYIRTLIPILGSETAAKDALLYSYTILSGFLAMLTPQQASRLQIENLGFCT